MVLHHTFPSDAARGVRALALAAACAVAVVTGTALLIAAFSGNYDGSVVGADGQSVTMAEVVMQQAAERALVSPRTEVLASTVSNARHGF
ncbi:MAG: hypothetical protein ABI907_12220 [Ramlibacter sp.]